MNQQPPSLFGEWYVIFPCLAPGPVKIDIDLSLCARFILLSERKRKNIGNVVVAEKPAIDPADRPASHKNHR